MSHSEDREPARRLDALEDANTDLAELAEHLVAGDELVSHASYFIDSAEGVALFRGFDRTNGHRVAHEWLAQRLAEGRRRHVASSSSSAPQ